MVTGWVCQRVATFYILVYALAVCAGQVAEKNQVFSRPGFLGSLEGHTSAIYALAFAKDEWIASGAKDGGLYVWNTTGLLAGMASKTPFRRFGPHRRGVTALTFAGDDLLLSGSADNTTKIWDVRSGEVRNTVQHPRTVFGVAAPSAAGFAGLSPPGEFATGCWDGVVRRFRLPGGEPLGELEGHQGGIYSVSYSPLDNSLLASAGADGRIKVWDVVKSELLWTVLAHADHATSVDWSPREPLTFASSGWDRKMRLWTIGVEEANECRSAGTCHTMNSLKPRFVGRHPQLVWRVVFSPDGSRIAACHGAVGQSPTVVIYDTVSGEVVRRLGRHRDTPLSISWSLTGSILASAGMDRRVLLYDGAESVDDFPRGDPDNLEEQVAWTNDLIEFQTGKPADNKTGNSTALPDMNPPHPLGSRVAMW